MSSQNRSIWPGIVLILIGALMLVRRLELVEFTWRDLYPFFFLLLGFWFWVRIFTDGNRRLAFPATFFTLLGIRFLARYYGHVWWLNMADSWPLLLIIFGLSLLVQYAFTPEKPEKFAGGLIFLF
ncbi:MAG TPA: hypothetical protein ENJ23_03595, partial [Bacteroidetes bacterium]|nr:hypothetical protein [Bacteroidota bacterium]